MSSPFGLNIGDIVRLISGSWDWKVISLDDANSICTVEWYHEGIRHEHILPQVCVDKVR
jgi:hypothetical protein